MKMVKQQLNGVSVSVVVGVLALTATADPIWVDPGVGKVNVYDQSAAEAAGFGSASVVFASGTNVFQTVTMDIANVQVGTNDVAHATTWQLDGGAINVTDALRIGTQYGKSAGSEGVLHVTGGQHQFSNVAFANDRYSKAELVIDGGDETSVTLNSSGLVWFPQCGKAHAAVRHGKLTTKQSLYLGMRSNVTGAVGEGTIDVYENGTLSCLQLFIGGASANHSGYGEVNVYGGKVSAEHIALSYGSLATGGTCYLRQYGGLVEVTKANASTYYGIHLPETNGRSAEYDLMGGVVSAVQIYRNASSGEGIFKADGGTFQLRAATTTAAGAAIRGLTTAALGKKGLTLDTRTYATMINQSFSDLEGAEGEGRLVKVGTSALTVANASTAHSKTVVAEGSLVFSAAATTWTDVVVTNGATVSTIGSCATLGLSALQLGDVATTGCVGLDSADVISVDKPVVIGNSLVVQLGDAPAVGTYDVLSCAGAVDELTVARWMGANVTGLATGTRAKTTASYSQANGRTTFRITVEAAADDPALTDVKATWSGAAGDTWSSAAWTTTPAVDNTVNFESETAASTVTVDVEAKVGAVRFSAEQGYSLVGDGPLAMAETTTAGISVEKGRHTIETPVVLGERKLPIEVSKDAELTVDGFMVKSGFIKNGGGRLLLSNPGNCFNLGFDLMSGLLGFESTDALGGGQSTATVRGGTLQLADSASEAALNVPVRINTPSQTGAAVLKADSDVTLKDYSLESGTMVKRGVGRLTVDIAAGKSVFLGRYTGVVGTNTVHFDDNGTAPTNGYRLLQVAEGELRYTAGENAYFTGGNANSHILGIGMNTPDGTVNPALTFDGASNTEATKLRYVYVGEFAGADAFWTAASLNVTNGAAVYADSIMGPNDYSEHSVTTCVNVCEGSVLHATYAHYLGYTSLAAAREKKNKFRNAKWLVSGGSRLSAGTGGGFLVGGPVSLTVDDGSVLASGPNHEPAKIALQWNSDAGGEFRFKGHSSLCLANDFTFFDGTGGFRFVFDDGVWETGTETELELKNTNVRWYGRLVEKGGIEMPVASGRTVTMAMDLTGEGPFVKSGAGTLVFRTKLVQNATTHEWEEYAAEPKTLCCEGGVRVKGGTLKVCAHAAVDGLPVTIDEGAVLDMDGSAQTFSAVSGAGALKNGSLGGFSISAGSVPVLQDVAIGGRVYVDFGRTEDNPLLPPYPTDVVVAKISGTTTCNPSRWKVANTGVEHLSGRFTVKDGEVRMTVNQFGLMMIVR